MQRVIILIVVAVVALIFSAPRLWKASLNEETGSTRVNLPSFNDYDNSQFPPRDKLLLAANYLASVDSNSTYFLESKESATKKITQYVGDLDVVLKDVKDNNDSDPNLEKFRAEGTAELDEIKLLTTPNDLQKLKSVRALYINSRRLEATHTRLSGT